jgi:phosphatidylserine/phosphatidylglycerophosphate/cardiolipin synthase-like enzyme
MAYHEPILGNEFSKKVIPLINSADISINIMIFDWRWYPHKSNYATNAFNNAILKAKDRGVKIKVLTNGYDTRQALNSHGIVAKSIASSQLLHSKLIIVDEKHLVIGSHNFTQPAFISNIEASIMVKDCECIEDFINFFKNLYANGNR